MRASLAVTSLLLAACSSSTSASNAPNAPPSGAPPRVTAPAAGPDLLPGCTLDPGAPAGTVDPSAPSDPAGGAASFTLDKALAGFPQGAGKLVALVQTEEGPIRCELDADRAPRTVANFVGLARGTRPFRGDDGRWTLGRFYDGIIWHRVVPGFVIQGGDPGGTGTGGPGYDLPTENQIEEPLGTLAMAAAARPSGSQFYVVVGKGPPPQYNVFGSCAADSAVKIAGRPRGERDRPTTDVHMLRIDIARCP